MAPQFTHPLPQPYMHPFQMQAFPQPMVQLFHPFQASGYPTVYPMYNPSPQFYQPYYNPHQNSAPTNRNESKLKCKFDNCQKEFVNRSTKLRHERRAHLNTTPPPPPHSPPPVVDLADVDGQSSRLKLKDTALRGCVVSYSADVNSSDVKNVLHEYKPDILYRIEENLRKWVSVKWYMVVWVHLSRADADGNVEVIDLPLRSSNQLCFRQSPHLTHIESAAEKIMNTFEEVELTGSGWQLDNVTNVDLGLVKNAPLIGCGPIDLPRELASMANRSLINIRSDNGDCFALAVLACLHSDAIVSGKRNDPAEYVKFRERYDFAGFSPNAPVSGDLLKRFETTNKISVNLYGFENSTVFPICITTEQMDRHVDILFLGESAHYVAIKSLRQLLRRQCSDHSRQICRFCLQSVHNENQLQNHQAVCSQFDPLRVELPPPGSTLSFKNIHKQHPVIGRIYGDLESFLVPASAQHGKTKVVQMHQNCSAAGIFIGADEQVERFLRRRDSGETELICVTEFIRFVERSCKAAYMNARKKMIPLTPEEQMNFDRATVCYICGLAFHARQVGIYVHIDSNNAPVKQLAKI